MGPFASICLDVIPSLNTVMSQQKHDGQRVTQEAYENGLVDTYQEREGKRGWRKGAVERRKALQKF